MTNILLAIIAFIVAIGVLITFHELGHYLAARLFNVKVLRFSIGIGKPLIRWLAGPDKTEYTISPIPLGGYVKFFGDKPHGVTLADKNRSFYYQSLLRRTLIIAAGPMFNFFLAILIFWVINMIGITGVKPIIDDIQPNSPAYFGGLQAGDQILRINKERTITWKQVRHTLLSSKFDEKPVQVDVRGIDSTPRKTFISYSSIPINGKFLNSIGIKQRLPDPPPIIGGVVNNSPAQLAGLKQGDQILKVQNDKVTSWSHFTKLVQSSHDTDLHLDVSRNKHIISLIISPEKILIDNVSIGKIGATQISTNHFDHSLMILAKQKPGQAFMSALEKTWDITILSLQLIRQIVTNDLSIENLSGPIAIAKYAGITARDGIITFLGFIALISVSIGILNLLPIPMLDGGHLVLNVMEAVKRKPMSDKFLLSYQKLGLCVILCIFGIAFYNDIGRLLS